MKKLIALLLAAMMVLSLGACGAKKEEAKTPLTDPLEKIAENIYAIKAPQFGPVSIPVDINDTEWSLYSFTGLTSNEGIKEAMASESMIGAIPYSLVLVRVEDCADTKAIAEQMKAGIDQRKWICVEADDLLVSGYCDLIMLVMVGSEFAADGITAQAMTDAFEQVCGAELDFTI